MNDKKREMKSYLLDVGDQIAWLKSTNDLLAAVSAANAHGELGQEALYALEKLYETVTDEFETCFYALNDCFEEEDGQG